MFDYKDAKDLYAGKPLKVDRIKSNQCELSNQIMQYNPVGMNMTVKPCKQQDNALRKNRSGLKI